MASIHLRDISFSYPLINRSRRIANGTIRSNIPVFSKLSLDVADGTRLAVIGPNGSGKTTLLKIIAGILPPASGNLRVQGTVLPLLRVRRAMESELTGIENIWLRGAYMGRTRSEIEEKLPHIVEFADLGDFIELPLNTYSAGMVARLAFSIASSFEPEILLIDESIAAGDQQFAEKAAKRMRELVDKSNILLFATHSTRLMRTICDSAFDVATGEFCSLDKR
jgi:ABC-type polysaccharide/polyol phosphate transport system ATPase subunit